MEIICCVCNRKKSAKGWIKQFPDRNKVQSHGYCPKCYRQVVEKVQARILREEAAAA
ncbi:MAG: hypothetical protein KKG47_15920 [Proteobacteria bacterium]|nr:hypothetical protein [Pseudomonadota bacterium]MBU1739563.1 hypothetical protein [Pseudomonadota bacterium]